MQGQETMTPPPTASHAASTPLPLAPESRFRHVFARVALWLLEARSQTRARLMVDTVVLYLASAAALFASPVRQLPASAAIAAIFPLLVLAILYARRSPDDRLLASRLDTAAHVLGVVSLAAMLTIALDTFARGAHPVALAIRLWLFAAVYLTLARSMLVSIRRRAVTLERFAKLTLIVGAGTVGERLVRHLTQEAGYGLRPVGFLDTEHRARTEVAGAPSIPILGGPEKLAAAVSSTGARHVILAFTSIPDHKLIEQARECQRLGVEVSLVPRLYEAISEHATMDHVGGLPLVALRDVDPHGWQFAIKHAFDRAFAVMALVALAPLMLVIALAVRLSSPGPILFRQRRVGRDGREFELLKFRTMRVAESSTDFTPKEGYAPGGVEGEDRRTRVGTILRDLSLDEMPQFINVLRGEMSIVGPRPERPEFVERFTLEVQRYDDRHRVKSGITGWAQVHGLRGPTSIADRVEWDNYYIRNWSLRLDLQIIARTIGEMMGFGRDR